MKLSPKDFQAAAARRIYEIYRNDDHNRVLLADEVGLGKTIIAREVIRLVSDWHKEMGDDHFKVVYVCSNLNIARQNYKKLGIAEEDCLSVAESRLSMQHLRIYQSKQSGHNYQQLIPLTPATSLQITSGQGWVQERALIFAILETYPAIGPEAWAPLNKLLQYDVSDGSWHSEQERYRTAIRNCDEACGCYFSDMHSKLDELMPHDLQDALNAPYGSHPSFGSRSSLVTKLRCLFAQISLSMLEPDLVVMDEFQRFKDLISPSDDEAGMLARQFLGDATIKVLLLSATPYRPYSTFEEIASGEPGHYQEFIEVMNFLNCQQDRAEHFREIWSDYSHKLGEIRADSFTTLLACKTRAEDALYRCVCRTERLGTSALDDKKAAEIRASERDIQSFVDIQQLSERLGIGAFPVEYVKSAPYLMSFMNYKVKEQILQKTKETGDSTLQRRPETMLIRKNHINSYKDISLGNARLEALDREIFQGGRNDVERLLWVPASLPYYRTTGVFSKNRGFSKLLVFSAWEMVPRMISGMVSYRAERLLLCKQKNGSILEKAEREKYFTDENRRSIRLRDGAEELLARPCRALAKLYKPLEYMDMPLSEIRRRIRPQVEALLRPLRDRLTDDENSRARRGAKQYIELLKALDCQRNELSVIPDDAADLLTDLAIGGPAICGLRLFHNDCEYSAELGKLFVQLFNRPESIWAVDAVSEKRGDDGFFYEDVIHYCVEGNLQAVLDEYAYSIGETKVALLDSIKSALIRTASVQIDTVETVLTSHNKPRLRTHFAVGYYNAKIDEKAVNRTESIRHAFNSPFWPFVLATTSIGQEGLDFHAYCRKIMHWNLPSNPIDIEQREGRINRYLCLSVRQSLAESAYANPPFQRTVWDEILDRASVGEKKEYSDLVPFWSLPESFGAKHKIERIVPMFPMSRDKSRYDRMISILALYRMTLGQPRQEELMDVLKQSDITEEQLKSLYMNLSPFCRKA